MTQSKYWLGWCVYYLIMVRNFFFFFGFRIFNFHDTIFVKVEEAYMTKPYNILYRCVLLLNGPAKVIEVKKDVINSIYEA